jgi:FHA domain-containing protein/regulatory LuxR family protein
MNDPAPGPRALTARELKEQIEAERSGRPFLVHRDAGGEHRVVLVGPGTTELWVGRSDSAHLSLGWDREVSSLHAHVDFVGDECTLVDEGLSRNGSFVNGERVRGRRRLRDGDMMRFGQTVVMYRAPGAGGGESTVVAGDALTAAGVSPAQRKVLTALCRPFRDGAAFATPATNQQIADELHLSVDAVKSHLRALFEKFGLEAMPQNRKRVALVERALQAGLVTEREL